MKTAGLQVTHQEVPPDLVVITLTGKMMLGESAAVESLILSLLGSGRRKFIVDLSGVTHIDSTGIGRFISSFNKIMAVGGEMRMAGASGHVMQSFRVSLLDKVFTFYPTLQQAL